MISCPHCCGPLVAHHGGSLWPDKAPPLMAGRQTIGRERGWEQQNDLMIAQTLNVIPIESVNEERHFPKQVWVETVISRYLAYDAAVRALTPSFAWKPGALCSLSQSEKVAERSQPGRIDCSTQHSFYDLERFTEILKVLVP